MFVSKALPFSQDKPMAITGLSVPSIGGMQNSNAVITSGVLQSTVSRDEAAATLEALAGVTPTTEPTAEAAGGVAQVSLDPFSLYTVQDGDTAAAIAARYGIDLQYLLWANPDLQDGEFLAVGQTLVIPNGNGILHHVRYGETLSDVAARYGVTVDEIIAWQGNQISSADSVIEDQMVFVPGGTESGPTAPPSAAPGAAPTDSPVAVVAAPPVETEPPPAAAVVASSGLIWPVSGPISSYYGPSHPLGIDIDLYANPNGAIAAATSGTVTFAGGDPCCSYGLYVVIVSPDGIETLYAHLSVINVSIGQTVNQGQIIGNGGCTGYCTGNHLHFEVIDNGVRVDPLAYLP